jgi:Isochorismatase family
VHKRWSDAFAETPLARELEARGIRYLVVVGAQTELCVDATVRPAASLGPDRPRPRGRLAEFSFAAAEDAPGELVSAFVARQPPSPRRDHGWDGRTARGHMPRRCRAVPAPASYCREDR